MELCQAVERFDKMDYVDIYLEGAVQLNDSGMPRYPQ